MVALFRRHNHSGAALWIAVLLATACSRSISSAPTANDSNLSTQSVLTLAIGEEKAALESIRLKLIDVAEDSRCPTDVTCVWSGDATIRLEGRTERAAPTALVLRTATESDRTARFDQFVITLVRLTPQPVSGRPIRRDEYRVELSVSKDPQ